MLERQGFRKTESERSIAFWADGRAVVGYYAINALIDDAGDKNARICLHVSPESPHHDMIILEHAGRSMAPHRHGKSETLHIMRGSLMVRLFNDDGSEKLNQLLEPGMICRIEAGTWHACDPSISFCVYHESKPGPFLGEDDREFAPWVKA